MIKAVTEAETTVSAHERRPSSALQQVFASQIPETCKPTTKCARQGSMAEAKKKAKAKGKAKGKGKNPSGEDPESDDDAWGSEWGGDNDTIEYCESQQGAPKRARY